MTMPKLSKNKILIIGLLVVAAVGYYLFKPDAAPEDPLVTSQSGITGSIGQELVIELNRLKALQNINDDIFKDPTFVSLQDFTQVVIPQPLGRNNPFAPIGTSN